MTMIISTIIIIISLVFTVKPKSFHKSFFLQSFFLYLNFYILIVEGISLNKTLIFFFHVLYKVLPIVLLEDGPFYRG